MTSDYRDTTNEWASLFAVCVIVVVECPLDDSAHQPQSRYDRTDDSTRTVISQFRRSYFIVYSTWTVIQTFVKEEHYKSVCFM